MSVSVLLPTRGRPDSLYRAVGSLLSQAADPDGVQICYAVDPCESEAPTRARVNELLRVGDIVHTPAARLGYARLHEYYNELARLADGDWLLLFNDDALMRTAGWDTAIGNWDGQDVILDCRNNMTDQMILFPVAPARFVHAIGHYSLSPHCDSWIQDIARALGIARPVNIEVFHDRYDLTGAHDDATWREGRSGLRHEEYFGPEMTALRAADAEVVRRLIEERAACARL